MASRRTLPIALVIVAMLVAIAAGGAYLYWQNYLRSPQYSLAMLAGAVTEHDWPGVQKYVDVEAIVDAGVEAEIDRTLDGKNGALPGLAKMIAEAGKPTLTKIANEALMEAVLQERDWGAPAAGKFAGVIAVSAAAQVDISGDIARVSVTGPPRVGTIRFTMQRAGDHWRIVAIDDAIGLITRVTNLTGVGDSGRAKPRFELDALNAAQVIKALRAVGVPMKQVVYLSKSSDPERLVGGAGGCRQKAVWSDAGTGRLDPADPDGTVEIFATPGMAARRLRQVKASGKAPTPGELELDYPIGNALIRIGGPMTPERAAAYQRIFNSLP